MAEVKVRQGVIRGRDADGVYAFLGVPYAAAPVGERRMREPQPVAVWDGVRQTTEYGPTALKPPYPAPINAILPEPVIPGEDCLNLNVWTPQLDSGALPVFVWIHGGGFTNGTGAIYNGHSFARDGVVCVTINYRLGVDGFLYTGEGQANLGLLDQVAALEWVQDNIAAFGGDPANVTVGGESAGAMSVTALMTMPSARGLFRRVIAESGAGHHALRASTALHVTGHLAHSLGIEPTVEAFAQVPLDRLVAGQEALAGAPQANPDPDLWGEILQNLMAFEPVIDGDILPSLPIEAIQAGAGSDLDLLLGTTAEEFRLFLGPSGVVDIADDALVAAMTGAYGLPAAALEQYRANRPAASPGEVLVAAAGDFFFRIPAIRVAEARLTAPGATYMYEFMWRSPAFDGKLGACHAVELPFVFDDLGADENKSLVGPNPPQELATSMHAAWVRFIATGDPGWPAYEGGRRQTMQLDVSGGLVDDPRSDERQLWDGLR